MYCKKCGMNLAENVLFCRYCGQVSFMPIFESNNEMKVDQSVTGTEKEKTQTVTSTQFVANSEPDNSTIQDNEIREEKVQQDSINYGLNEEASHDTLISRSPVGIKQNVITDGVNTSEKKFAQLFYKEGKLTTLSIVSAIAVVVIIGLIIAINACINISHDSKKSANKISEKKENSKLIVLDDGEKDLPDKQADEIDVDKDKPLQEDSKEIRNNSEDGLPEDIYEKIKGTYYSGVNFIAYKITAPDEIINDWGEGSEVIKIEKYEEMDGTLLLYVDSGSIVQSWSDEKGNYYLSLLEGGGWDYEKTHVYSTLERISEYTSVTFDEIMATYYSTKYYAPDFDLEKRSDGFIYLVPISKSSALYPVDEGDTIPISREIKIAKDAQIGIADSYYYDSKNQIHFDYKYFDFYETIDTLISKGHWTTPGGILHFSVGEESFMLCPIITLDPSFQVSLFAEGYQSNTTSAVIIPPNEINESDAWYGELLAEGDAYEGGMPEETYEQIKGKYDDSYREADIISPNQIKYGFIGDNLVVFNIYGCDVDPKSNTLYIYAEDGSNQCMFSVKKENNNFVLKYCMGHWNSNQFAPDATLFKK